MVTSTTGLLGFGCLGSLQIQTVHRTDIGRFEYLMYKRGLIATTACDCGVEQKNPVSLPDLQRNQENVDYYNWMVILTIGCSMRAKILNTTSLRKNNWV